MPETYRASVAIKFNGVANTDIVNDLIAATVESSMHLPSMLTVELFDDDLKWVDDSNIKLGNPVTVTFGEEDDPANSGSPAKEAIFDGEITSVEPRFGKDGRAVLMFRAYDKSHRLHRGRKSRTFLSVADSDVVSTIAGEAGLTANAKTTSTKFDYLVQTNQTDMEFLNERARRIGYWAFASKGKLYFQPPSFNLGDGPELEWPTELREFRPRLSVVGQPAKASAEGWDLKTKAVIEGTATTATKFNVGGVKDAAGAAADSAFKGDGKSNIAIVHRPMIANAEATGIAQAALDEAASEYLQADAEATGDVAIMAGVTVTLKKVGKRFEGKYLVTSATHIYKRGTYITRFTMTGRQPNTFRSLVGSARNVGIDRPQAEVTGVVVGIVTNAEDDDELGRVKVKFPWLPKDDKGVAIESAWARVASPMAGAQRGFLFTPAVDDEVLLAFEHGDPNTPYVLGGLWNKTDKPPIGKADYTNKGATQQHMIKTKSGHVVILDDTKDKEQIVIRDKSTKNEIIITTKDNTIQINADKDIKLTAKGNINFKADGDITLDGKTFKVTTDQDSTVSAANYKVDAKQNVNVNGTKIDLEGKTGVTIAAAGVGKIEVTSAKTSINSGGLDVM